MKACLCTLFFCCFSFLIYAQDVIIKKTGQRIPCKIITVDSVKIQYSAVTPDGSRAEMEINLTEVESYRWNFQQHSGDKPFQRPALDQSKQFCFSFGFLVGGGGITGIDIERLISPRMGVQAGIGLISADVGLNFHFKPVIRSSFISVKYWHQGFGRFHYQSLFGPSFVFRRIKWFMVEGGLAVPLSKGPLYNNNAIQTPVQLTFAIGSYLTF